MVSLAKQREIQRERQNQDKELRAECNSRMINTGAQKEAKKQGEQGERGKQRNREPGVQINLQGTQERSPEI